jgi:hypothetical protein
MQGLTLTNFSTSDLALSATLICNNIYLDSIDKSDPRKALFIFKSSQELQKTIEKYWRGELRIEPRRYFDNLKSLKARLYGGV